MVSTPTLARAAWRFDCGIMVTASHNPSSTMGSSYGTRMARRSIPCR
jgi:phosphomannomutase